MNLTYEELIILSAIALDNENFIIKPKVNDYHPKNQQYRDVCNTLIERNLIDTNFKLTNFGRAVIKAKRKGMNFEKEATRRGIPCSISMIVGGLKGIQNNMPYMTKYDRKLIPRIFNTMDNAMEKIGNKIEINK